MSGYEQTPFSVIVAKHKTVTSGTSMITRAPYVNGQYYRIRKIECNTMDPPTTSGALWKFWDQDLSSTTAIGTGSAASALLLVGPSIVANSGAVSVTVSGQSVLTVSRDFYTTIRTPFYTGVTVATNQNSTINVELEVV